MRVPEPVIDPPVTTTPTLPPSRRLIWLLTVATGASVANLYYNQPLLSDIARTFHSSPRAAGWIATLTQAGYAVGMLLFVPLGDIVERRRLITTLLCVVAVALLATGLGPTLAVVIAASFAIGVTNVVPQLILPFAAGLSPPAMRGRIVGQVVSGLLVGILAGRAVAGAVSHVAGWRSMYVGAAVAMLLLAFLLRRMLPLAPASTSVSYGTLIRSLGTLFRGEPIIRDAGLLGALTFASFSAFWTTLAFRLQAPPLHSGSAVAGAFGLIGLAGAAAAPLAGRIADKRNPRKTVGISLLGNIAAWIVLLFFGHTLAGIALGVLLLDAATQVAQVSNQARVYALPAAAHSRFNTIYMVLYFVGGASGSALSVFAWDAYGWNGVCAVSLGALSLAYGVYLVRRDRL
ncbi:MAG: transporter [Gemmatimonadetes bacterium]|nr:transporter [Gemmatimonadota bacterium]